MAGPVLRMAMELMTEKALFIRRTINSILTELRSALFASYATGHCSS